MTANCFEHFFKTFVLSLIALFASFFFAINAVFPCLFPTHGKELVSAIYAEIENTGSRKHAAD